MNQSELSNKYGLSNVRKEMELRLQDEGAKTLWNSMTSNLEKGGEDSVKASLRIDLQAMQDRADDHMTKLHNALPRS